MEFGPGLLQRFDEFFYTLQLPVYMVNKQKNENESRNKPTTDRIYIEFFCLTRSMRSRFITLGFYMIDINLLSVMLFTI